MEEPGELTPRPEKMSRRQHSRTVYITAPRLYSSTPPPQARGVGWMNFIMEGTMTYTITGTIDGHGVYFVTPKMRIKEWIFFGMELPEDFAEWDLKAR